MKVVLQRAKYAEIKVEEKVVGKIENGLLIFLGIGKNDNENIADKLVKKICNMRIFEDENNKMNKSIKDINGDIDPIKMDNNDTKFLYDNEDDGVYDLKNGNPNG